jgi:hypothetical protein
MLFAPEGILSAGPWRALASALRPGRPPAEPAGAYRRGDAPEDG